MFPLRSDVFSFAKNLSDEFKTNYARAVYALLCKQDNDFLHAAKRLHLGGKETDVDDRFLFLYLCRNLLDRKDDRLKKRIYAIRERGFYFILHPTAKQIGIVANIRGWNTKPSGEEDDAQEQFLEAWRLLPEEDRRWMQDIFDNLPSAFPEANEKQYA